MAGIEDVQPKGINIPGNMVGNVEPAATTSAMQQLQDAFHKGFITTNDILAHPGGNALAQGLADQKKIDAGNQSLNEQMAPEAVAARYEAQQLVGDKARQERETLLTQDFINAWKKYNLPLVDPKTGRPDNKRMAEGGQKYAESERALAYAEAGLKGTPRTYIDPVTRNQYTVIENIFGENITPPGEGKKNPFLEKYQKMAHENRSYLIKNKDEPGNDVSEGEEPSGYEVSPTVEAKPAALIPEPPSAAPMVTPITSPTVEAQIQQATEAPAQVLFTPGGDTVVQPAARPITPIAVRMAQPLNIPGMPVATGAGVPVVVPSTPQPTPVVVQTNAPVPVAAKPTVEVPPAFVPPGGGPSYVTALGNDEPEQKIVAAVKASELYKNWAERSAPIKAFRAVKQYYDANPEDENTGQNDKDLLTTASQIASMSSSGGSGRAMMNEIKLVEAKIPTWDRIKDAPDIVLKRNLFPKPVRNRIISMVERHVKGVESLAGGALKTASDQILSARRNPAKYFSPDELALFGGTSGEAAGGTSGGPAIYKTTEYGGRKFRVTQ